MFNKEIKFIQDQFSKLDFIPLHAPVFLGNEKKYVLETIDSTFVSSVGAFVDQFEHQLQDYTQSAKAVAVVNGTAALQMALRLVGVQPGDEVITQALTFVATANAIAYNGAEPIFLDVDLETMGLSPKSVKEFLELHAEKKVDHCVNKKTGKKISACLPMHTFGFPVHLNELIEICQEWHIPIVEDAAESIGSEYHGKMTGSFGQMGTFSFNGNKTITCGGGGAIVTQDANLGARAKHLSTTAKQAHPFEFYHDELGYNFRMPNLNAALACAQLELLPQILANKRELAHQYQSYFKEQGICFRTELPETKANYWLMCLELENKAQRDIFLKETNLAGVMTRPIWQLMHRLPMYKDCQRDAQVNAQFLEERIVNIPSSYRP
jgi:aminotransferase in exopolysaccharide biosynthesis